MRTMRQSAKSTHCYILCRNMRKHLPTCTRRRDCSKCNLDYSSIGMFGVKRSVHERCCLTNNDFQQQYLDWLAGTVNFVVSTNDVIGRFGFPKKGFAKVGPAYSKAECTKKYKYIRGKLLGNSDTPLYDQPRYHQLLEAVNNVRGHRGMEPLENKFPTSG
jgi:hypothetical protein